MSQNLNTRSKKMKSQNSILEYLVNIHINEVDKKGKIKGQSFDKKFNSKDLLKNRREAIEYYIDQSNFFLQKSGIDFSSPFEAEQKNYKDYKCFSITLQVSYHDGTCIDIDEPDSIFEFLDLEAEVFKNYPDKSLVEFNDFQGYTHTTLEENFSFFYSLLMNLSNENSFNPN